MPYVEKSTIAILGVLFTILITSSIQVVSADHQLPGDSIFMDQTNVHKIDEINSDYQIYLQIEIRNKQGQLINVVTDSHGKIIPHGITDKTFNETLGKIEIITIDNIQYEKVRYTLNGDAKELLKNHGNSHFLSIWKVIVCTEIEGHGHTCLTPFSIMTPGILINEEDSIQLQWTILREIY